MPSRLTPQLIKAIPVPASGNRIEWDEVEPGLGIRVTANDARSFVLRYVIRGRERRMTLGKFPDLNLTMARTKARRAKAVVLEGHDPLAEREGERAALTLGEAVKIYLAGRANGSIGQRQLRPRSLAELRVALNTHWKPLHRLLLAEIDVAAIERRLHAMVGPDGIKGRVAANRARGALSQLFTWAVKKGHAPFNPASQADPVVSEKHLIRKRYLNEHEVQLLWKATAGPGDYSTIIRLLLLTGQRRSDVAGLRWSEFDLGRAVWTLPEDRTKNSLRHAVPLAGPVLDILQKLPRREGRDLVFGRGRGPFSSWSQSHRRLNLRIARLRATERLGRPLGKSEVPDAELDYLPHWRRHDLRRTVVTGMNDLGVLPHVVEAVVNHISGDARRGVAGVYNHAQYSADKRRALDLWAEHVMGLVSGEGAKVVPLRAGTAVIERASKVA